MAVLVLIFLCVYVDCDFHFHELQHSLQQGLGQLWNRELDMLFQNTSESTSTTLSSSVLPRRKRCHSVLSSDDELAQAVPRTLAHNLPATFDCRLRLALTSVVHLASGAALRNLLLHQRSFNGMTILHHAAFLELSSTIELLLTCWEQRKALRSDRQSPSPPPARSLVGPPPFAKRVKAVRPKSIPSQVSLEPVSAAEPSSTTPSASTATTTTVTVTTTTTTASSLSPQSSSKPNFASNTSPHRLKARTLSVTQLAAGFEQLATAYSPANSEKPHIGSTSTPTITTTLQSISRGHNNVHTKRHSVGVPKDALVLSKDSQCAFWVPIVDICDVNGRTPLHIAARLGNRELVATFLCHRASPSYVQRCASLVALASWTSENNTLFAVCLVDALVRIRDARNRLAGHYARAENHNEIVVLLQQWTTGGKNVATIRSLANTNEELQEKLAAAKATISQMKARERKRKVSSSSSSA
jgi:hypothetical protein